MANRNTLHVNDLELFKKYLTMQNILFSPPKGEYQVLVVVINGRNSFIYGKEKTCRGNPISHYTIQDGLIPIAFKFLKWKKRNRIESPDKEG